MGNERSAPGYWKDRLLEIAKAQPATRSEPPQTERPLDSTQPRHKPSHPASRSAELTFVPIEQGVTRFKADTGNGKTLHEVADLEIDVMNTAKRLRELLDKGEYDRGRFGAALGGIIVRLLALYDLPHRSSQERQNTIEKLRRMLTYYREVIPEGEYDQRINGAIAEYAVAETLSSELNCDVYLPGEMLDVNFGVDLIVDTTDPQTDNPVKLMQIKALDDPLRLVHVIKSEQDIVRILNNYQGDVDKNRIRASLLKLLDYSRKYTNTEAVVVTLPSLSNENNLYVNAYTGEPNKELAQALYQELFEGQKGETQ